MPLPTTGAGTYGVVSGGGGGGTLNFTIGSAPNKGQVASTPTLPWPNTGSDINIGTASADRIIVVAIQWIGATATASSDISAVIVNGVTLTSAAHVWAQAAQRGHAVYWGLVTSGSGSQNLSITAAGGSGFINDICWQSAIITGSATASVSSSQTSIPPGYGSNSPISGAVTVATGGVCVISSYSDYFAATPTTSSWANTTSSSADLSSNTAVNAIGWLAHAIASATVVETIANTSGQSGWSSVSFQP